MSSYLAFRYHGLIIGAFSFPGLSLVLSGSILLVRLIGFPESRVKSKENVAAMGEREPALAQASIPMICFLL